jgi:hypothetical protein
MYRKTGCLLLLILFSNISCGIADTKKLAAHLTEIVLISSMHGYHRDHPTYDFETLYQLVRSYSPDYVGVEIRPEDIRAPDAYLRRNYPTEMIALLREYQDNSFAFDWLGDSIAGKPIPAEYWQNLEVKKLSRRLDRDQALLKNKPSRLEEISLEQSEILKNASPTSLNDGRYGQLCREADQLEALWLKGTDFNKIIEFDRLRDQNIGKNIIEFMSGKPGSRIVIVLGADHRTFALENIKRQFGDSVKVLSVTNLIRQ